MRTLDERGLVARQLRDITPPDTIPGLVCWLDAADITGLSDGDPVSAWADRSGNGNDFSQATANRQPLWQATDANGLPAVSFGHGTASHGMTSDTSLSFSTWSVMMFLRYNNVTSQTNRRMIQGASNNYLIGPFGNNWATFTGSFHNSRVPVATGDAGIGVQLKYDCLGQVHVADTSLVQYVDGYSISYTPGSTEIGVVALGASGAFDERASCVVAEIVMYARALTKDEMLRVTNYLRIKYGYQ